LEKPRAGEPVIDLLVDDIESAYQELRSKGVQFKSQPEEAQWGAREAVFTDPDGNELQLVQIKWEEYFKANAV
jgi:catechol 2,3-dioxygenase-like lactoylglutathione lyase family enzyme